MRNVSKAESTSTTVCCVIVLDKNNKILLIKRGKDPHKNKWALISGIGYIKKDKTLDEGVVAEVAGDITALPFNIKRLFSINNKFHEVVVFTAQVHDERVTPVFPHVLELKWCRPDEVSSFSHLAFEHDFIVNKYLDQQNSGGF